MEDLELFQQNNWVLQHLFHKSFIKKVKEGTKAYHVIHIKDHVNKNGTKINCLLMRGEKGECKYGGAKAFSDWTEKDYTNAINTYNNEFKAG